MIQAIFGKKGSGKTKRIIDMANDSLKEQKGDVVFIDDDNRYMFDLRHEIRFINAGEYGVANQEMFMGFLCGMLAQNFDVSLIFIDAFLKLVKTDIGQTAWFFERLQALGERYNVGFVLSVSCDPADCPTFLSKYII